MRDEGERVGDDLGGRRVVLPDPRLVEAQPVQQLDRLDVRCSEVVGFWVGGLLNGGMSMPKRILGTGLLGCVGGPGLPRTL